MEVTVKKESAAAAATAAACLRLIQRNCKMLFSQPPRLSFIHPQITSL